jgi:hypothetical protein
MDWAHEQRLVSPTLSFSLSFSSPPCQRCPMGRSGVRHGAYLGSHHDYHVLRANLPRHNCVPSPLSQRGFDSLQWPPHCKQCRVLHCRWRSPFLLHRVCAFPSRLPVPHMPNTSADVERAWLAVNDPWAGIFATTDAEDAGACAPSGIFRRHPG